MLENQHSTHRTPKVIVALGEELDRVAKTRGAGRRLRASPIRHGRRALVLAIVGALLAVGVAGAATGVLSVGTIISEGDDPTFEHGGPSPEQTVLATGTTPVAGAWRLTTYTSEGIADDQGGVAEAKGLPCVRLELTDPPAATPFQGSAFCLAPGKPEFNTLSVPVGDATTGKTELLLFGFAPSDARAVELTTGNAETVTEKTHDGAGKFPGQVWVVVAPSGARTGNLDWIGADGKPAGDDKDVSEHLDRLSMFEK